MHLRDDDDRLLRPRAAAQGDPHEEGKHEQGEEHPKACLDVVTAMHASCAQAKLFLSSSSPDSMYTPLNPSQHDNPPAHLRV
jgi:hypothetical protein